MDLLMISPSNYLEFTPAVLKNRTKLNLLFTNIFQPKIDRLKCI